MRRSIMVLSLVVVLSLLACPFVSAKEWVAFGNSPDKDAPVIQLLRDDQSGIDLGFDIPGMHAAELLEGDVLYTKLSMTNAGRKTEVGKPEVPVMSQFVEIPFDVNYTLHVQASSPKIIQNYTIYPAQAPAPDIAQFDDTVQFTRDELTYGTNAFYPAQIAFVETELIIRGHRLLKVVAQPVQYNPVTKELKVYANLKVEVRYDKAATITHEPRLASEVFDAMLQPLVINHTRHQDKLLTDGGGGGPVQEVPTPSPVPTPTTGGAEYLIITPDDFYTDAVALANWKTAKGLLTKVTRTSEIGATAFDVASYILGAYTYWDPAPTYVLLLGDAPFIPPYYKTKHPYHKTLTGTDLYFATVDGSDYYPDILVGRLPAKTVTEAHAMVQKVLNYEQHLYDNTYWYDDVLIAGYFQDDNKDGVADRWFLQTSEEVNDLLKAHQFNTTTSYVKTDGSPAEYYYDGVTPVPDTVEFLDPTVATQKISDVINSGVTIVNHRDHGASRNAGNSFDGWGEPYYTTNHAYALTNTTILPLVFTINCMTAWFDSETDGVSADYESLGEAFMRNQNAGAVGVIGATRVSYSGYNDDLCKGFYDTIYPDFKGTLNTRSLHFGAILNYGKMYMSQFYSSTDSITITEFEEFCLLGDPETTIRMFEDINVGNTKLTQYPAGIEKCYELKVNTASTYTLATGLNGTACDTVLYIYDLDWNLLASDDDSGVDLFSQVAVTLQPGIYYVKVEEQGNDGSLQFSISVN